MIKLDYKENIDLTIGAGGRAMHRLLDQLIFKEFDNVYLRKKSDQAIMPSINGDLAFTTDSYVVSPYFFNGGDIGTLAINGTINDLAVGGAKPLYIAVSFILEEGLPLNDLRTIVQSMAKAARDADVLIVTGDTKVVERGKGDAIFINTSAIGVVEHNVIIKPEFEIGDKLIINGSIADHGMAIMAKRQGLDFMTDIKSDCAALNSLIKSILVLKPSMRCMRDPTRGGVSATLNEWANSYHIGIEINETKLEINENVKGLCELLGVDPINVANEGKVLMICKNTDSDKVLQQMRKHYLGKRAEVIGEVKSITDEFVTLLTVFGGVRRVEWLNAEQLPRIC